MSRNVLKARRKDLKQQGLGNKQNKSVGLASEEEEKLWQSGELGLDKGTSLLNFMWFSVTKQMGFRGCDENHQLRWGDIQLKIDSEGQEYLEFRERLTKTRDGNSSTRVFNPKIFSNENKLRCPIEAYKIFRANRPEKMKQPDAPFYIAVNFNATTNNKALWFKSQPVGINKLRSIMKTMAKKAGLQGKITNHSVRKTMCSNLLHAGVAPTTIMQLSGHKNVASVNNYASASYEQQKQMCGILQQSRYNLGKRPHTDTTTMTNKKTETTTERNCNSRVSSKHKPDSPESKLVGHENLASGLFSGATIMGGTFNFSYNICSQTGNRVSPSKTFKRIRRPIIESDEEELS